MKTGKAMLDVLAGKKPARKPVWLMRQAGRYLPEYRAVRAKANGFLDLCLTPEMAVEVTLQPIRRFGFDAAILFADILLVPHGCGQKLDFKEGEGPVLEPVRDAAALASLRWKADALAPVYETVARLKSELPRETTLIGFAGAPWTVACYMIEGRGKTGFTVALEAARQRPDFIQAMINLLHQATLEYLGRQIEAGAEVVQLFDSWAGLLDDELFELYVIAPTKRLVTGLKAEYGAVPVIGFPRGVSADHYRRYAAATGVDAVSLDQGMDISKARAMTGADCVLQGNLDPEILVQGGTAMRDATAAILRQGGERHIFNLGHGVVPQTPPTHVEALVQQIRDWKD